MSVKINRLTNANVYVDGTNLLGRAEEVDAPKPMAIMSEHKTLGLNGKLEYPSGIDKMEMRIKWNAFYADVMPKFMNPWQAVKLMIRASQETWEGGSRVGQKSYVIYATAQPKGIPLGNFKSQDNVEMESSLACTQVKMEIDGVEIFEFDAEANIYRVNGVDLMATYRANIGA